jgi:hypothetical protein
LCFRRLGRRALFDAICDTKRRKRGFLIALRTLTD